MECWQHYVISVNLERNKNRNNKWVEKPRNKTSTITDEGHNLNRLSCQVPMHSASSRKNSTEECPSCRRSISLPVIGLSIDTRSSATAEKQRVSCPHRGGEALQSTYRNLVGTGFMAPIRLDIMRSSIPHLRVFVGNWRGFFKDLQLSDTTTLLGILLN